MINEYMNSKAIEYAPFNPLRVKKLFSQLQPHLKLNSYNIHIIGTNGKGSTGRFIAQSLWESKHSVLHFTSPHIFDFRERFYRNNAIIDVQSLESAHQFLQQFNFIKEASYFEYSTFLALVLAQDCEYLVMEAGVGGEYDSTSVLDYDITLFTKIGIDHKEMLGNSLHEIALTKLKAAQGEIFTHFQETEVLGLLSNLNSILLPNSTNQQLPYTKDSKTIHYLCQNDLLNQSVLDYAKHYNLATFLHENLALASLVLDYLKIPLLHVALDLPARFESIAPNIIVDVGHNEMAAQTALTEMQKRYNNQKFTLIYNSYKEKDVDRILEIFCPHLQQIIVFCVENVRILPLKKMCEKIKRLEIPYQVFNPKDSQKLDGLLDFLLESNKNYLVFGSFSLVEEFLCWYRNYKKV